MTINPQSGLTSVAVDPQLVIDAVTKLTGEQRREVSEWVNRLMVNFETRDGVFVQRVTTPAGDVVPEGVVVVLRDVATS